MNPLPISPAEGPGVAFTPCARYPDPAVLVLDPSFAKYRIYTICENDQKLFCN